MTKISDNTMKLFWYFMYGNILLNLILGYMFGIPAALNIALPLLWLIVIVNLGVYFLDRHRFEQIVKTSTSPVSDNVKLPAQFAVSLLLLWNGHYVLGLLYISAILIIAEIRSK